MGERLGALGGRQALLTPPGPAGLSGLLPQAFAHAVPSAGSCALCLGAITACPEAPALRSAPQGPLPPDPTRGCAPRAGAGSPGPRLTRSSDEGQGPMRDEGLLCGGCPARAAPSGADFLPWGHLRLKLQEKEPARGPGLSGGLSDTPAWVGALHPHRALPPLMPVRPDAQPGCTVAVSPCLAPGQRRARTKSVPKT